jgi:phytoene dehydrogenase-like protein
MTANNQWDVIVIGGGLAGLTAGATAAAAGASTVVLEAHTGGGRARTTERAGYVFNMGAHALYQGGGGMRVLGSLGIQPSGSSPPLDRYRLRLGGVNHRMPAGLSSLVRTHALSGRGKAQLASLLARLSRLDARRFEGVSVDDWLARLDLRPDADAVFRALIRISTYASDFSTFAADAALRQLQAAFRGGVLYLDGGWAQLVDALSAQVEVRSHHSVRGIEPGAGRVEVLGDQGLLAAKAVVVALGTPTATGAVLPVDPPWGDLGLPVTAACLDVGASRPPSPGYLLGIDDPIYVTTQAPPARQAPAGAAVVAGLRYGTRDAQRDRADLERYMAAAGLDPSDVVTSRFLADIAVCGAAPLAATGGLPGRPEITASGVDGVFIAGDWVGPEGLISDAALVSGQAAGWAAAQAGQRAATMVA